MSTKLLYTLFRESGRHVAYNIHRRLLFLKYDVSVGFKYVNFKSNIHLLAPARSAKDLYRTDGTDSLVLRKQNESCTCCICLFILLRK